MIRLQVGCKVNLGLHITGLRQDGYHLLDSIFYPLSRPCDTLELTERSTPGLAVLCDAAGVDTGHNTLTKAYTAFVQATGAAPGLTVHLHKGIPLGAGLGGGSSNAAALLLWLNRQAQNPLSPAALLELAAKVGADTPFFLQDRPCRVQGIGEKLSPLQGHYSQWLLLLVCPHLHVNTAWAFAQYDSLQRKKKPGNGQKLLTISESGDNGIFLHEAGADGDIATALHNDLEEAVFPHFPALAAIKARLAALGAQAVGMSGSGASMLALYGCRDAARAEEAAACMRQNGHDAFLLPLGAAGM